MAVSQVTSLGAIVIVDLLTTLVILSTLEEQYQVTGAHRKKVIVDLLTTLVRLSALE